MKDGEFASRWINDKASDSSQKGSEMTLSAGLILVVVGRMSHLLVKWLSPAKSISVTQWLERPTGVWKIMGSNPVEDSDFFLSPMLFIFMILGTDKKAWIDNCRQMGKKLTDSWQIP